MRVCFIGTGEIGVPTLRWLIETSEHELVGVVTQPDKPVGRKQVMTAPAVKAAIGDRSIPVIQPKRIKSDEAIDAIRGFAPDTIVVMAYGQILPRAVLEIPRLACLNLHASLLPRHRGAAPIQAAIVAGDAETGITVMYMAEGLDTGDILLQSPVQLSPDETGGSLHDKLALIAPDALRDALRQLAIGNAPRIPQDTSAATYAPKLERDDGRIDWGEPAAVIERKIRAFDPWPSAFTIVSGRKLKIFKAAVGESGSLVFRAADDALTIVEAQLEGGRRMLADELVRGHPWLAKP
ncbi:MAG: methionyl-tRNA formyltransferase [Chthoniobacterales bacterium]